MGARRPNYNLRVPWKVLDEPRDEDLRELKMQWRGKARFLVDESAGIGVARLIRGRGYNTKYVDEVQLRGRSDEEVFAFAWKERRLVVTHDIDFLDNRRFPWHRNPGVILIRPGSDGRNNEGLLLCLERALLFANDVASWFQGKKLDFSADETTVYYQNGRDRYLWGTDGTVKIWKESRG